MWRDARVRFSGLLAHALEAYTFLGASSADTPAETAGDAAAAGFGAKWHERACIERNANAGVTNVALLTSALRGEKQSGWTRQHGVVL